MMGMSIAAHEWTDKAQQWRINQVFGDFQRDLMKGGLLSSETVLIVAAQLTTAFFVHDAMLLAAHGPRCETDDEEEAAEATPGSATAASGLNDEGGKL